MRNVDLGRGGIEPRCCAPLLLFVFNRPEHTAQTLEALKKNDLSEATDLIIISDGPPKPEHVTSVNEVRKLIRNITGFKSVEIVERPTNMGLAASIIDGVTKICDERGRVIVLEDDLVTSPYFLRFMNDALDLYMDDERVISVGAYSFPLKVSLPQTYFLCDPGCWGWATWKRGWDIFEADGEKLLLELKKNNMNKYFNFDNSYDYVGMLSDQVIGRNSSWAVRWYASAVLAQKLTVYPGASLVQNIGNDGSGSHKAQTDVFYSEMASSEILLNMIPVVENLDIRRMQSVYFRSIRPHLLLLLLLKVKNIAISFKEKFLAGIRRVSRD